MGGNRYFAEASTLIYAKSEYGGEKFISSATNAWSQLLRRGKFPFETRTLSKTSVGGDPEQTTCFHHTYERNSITIELEVIVDSKEAVNIMKSLTKYCRLHSALEARADAQSAGGLAVVVAV